MKPYRLALLGLAAALLILPISGCGTAQEETTTTTEATTITTTELTTTTEAIATTETTAATLAAETQKEVTWQMLDLQDKVNAEQKTWLEKAYADMQKREPATEYPMGSGKVVGMRGEVPELRQIFLKENGKETVLLKEKRDHEYIDDATEDPRIAEILDDRYFVYRWIGWEWEAGSGVYDTVRMKAIPVETTTAADKSYAGANVTYAGAFGDILYMEDHWYAQKVSPLRLFPVSLKGLDKAESLPVGKNILEDIPEAKEKDVSYTHTWFSPDGRYYVAAQDLPFDSEDFVALIFDLSAKQFLSRVSVPKDKAPSGGAMFSGDNETLYIYGVDYSSSKAVVDRNAVEIKLP